MSNGSVYLNGSEDVRRAGSSIASAAEDMRQSANLMCESAMVLKLALANHAEQMRDIMEEHRQEMAKMLSTVARIDEDKMPGVVSVFNYADPRTPE